MANLTSSVLERCIPYIESVVHDAEVKHDDPEADTYMDGGYYATMKEGKELLKDLNKVLEIRRG